MGPRLSSFAALFYGGLIVAAALWSGLRGRELFVLGNSIPQSLVLGVCTAAVTVLAAVLAYRMVPAFRKLAAEVSPQIVDPAKLRDLVLISFFSGVGEEVFFRGAVQQEFGIVVAAVIFGLVHLGPDRRYLAWTVSAIAAGFLFGWLYIVTNGLLAPIIAHAAHNAAVFALWKRSRRALEDA